MQKRNFFQMMNNESIRNVLNSFSRLINLFIEDKYGLIPFRVDIYDGKGVCLHYVRQSGRILAIETYYNGDNICIDSLINEDDKLIESQNISDFDFDEIIKIFKED